MGASVVACCDAPPVLELAKHVLNFVPGFVERLVVFVLDFPVPPWRNAGLDVFGFQRRAELIAVITSVGDQRGCRRKVWIEQFCSCVVAHLAFTQQQHERLAVAIANRVQFRVQAAFGAPDAAGNIPFLSRLAAVR